MDGKSAHPETAFSTLGALSGYALQQGIREFAIKGRKLDEKKVFLTVHTNSNEKYYFSEYYDPPLYDTHEGRVSVWSLVKGAAEAAGATSFPNLDDLVRANTERVRTPLYGSSDVAEKHQTHIQPEKALRRYWPETK